MDANQHIAQGIQHAKSAITFDSAGQLQEALQYYTLTLQSLNAAIAIDTNEPRKEVTQKKANEYAARKAQLEERMAQQAPPSNNFTSLPPPGGINVAASDRALPAKPLPGPPPGMSGAQRASSPVVQPRHQQSGQFNTGSNFQQPTGFGNQMNQNNGEVPPGDYNSNRLMSSPAPTNNHQAPGTIGIGNAQSKQAYASEGELKILALWVTDSPVHKRVEKLKAAKFDVLLTQTFAEGMKVLRRNTNITHVINNVNRAGGKLAATTELITLVSKYDDMLPIILTTFEGEKKKKKISNKDLDSCLEMGAKCIANSMDDLMRQLKDVSPAPRQGANMGPTPINPQARFWGQSVFNANNLEYFVGDKIGSGNFGVIHDCRDVFGQDYVCKILKTNRPEEEVQADWAKETQFLFTLNHPNIVQLYDAFRYKNLYHMVMERCSGSLRDYVESYGALSGPDVVQVGGMILAGLHHIHQRNIIHRDLHVDNILYAPPRTASQKISIKISDFGISKLLRPTENAAVTFIGRDYDYCPELVTKGHTTKRSDIYQCGLVLYHVYTGKHALSAKDGNNVVQIVTSGLARQRAEQLNTKLGDVIGIMLRRAPEYRYKDCVETAAHLFAILD